MSGDTGIARVEAAPRVVDDLETCGFYHTMDVPGHGPVEGQWDLRQGLRPYLGGVNLAACRTHVER